MKNKCLFCKIVNKQISSDFVYEDENVYAFKDIQPKAPIHVLVVPKIHCDSLVFLDEKNVEMLAPLFLAAKKIASQYHILERGFRTVINCNPEGGQTVYHLHLHLLGGKQLGGAMVS